MSNPDLTKLIEVTANKAFMNNKIYTGSFSIGGSWETGYQEQTFTIPLSQAPDLLSSVFNGPTDTVFGNDPRPSSGWFKRGTIWVRGDNSGAGYTNYPTPWRITMKISGSNAIIKASSVNQTSTVLALTSTTGYYRIIDYSPF